jgi:DNA-binding NarL/FixJ family response regulator
MAFPSPVYLVGSDLISHKGLSAMSLVGLMEKIVTGLSGTEKDKKSLAEARVSLSYEVEATVMPLLKRLKEAGPDPQQSAYLINILESNLQHLVTAYGRSESLAAAYQQLSPVETLVASMIRQGHATKTIAETLHIAAGTVSIHRKHIRKKLGLDNKSTNLESYLKSLEV